MRREIIVGGRPYTMEATGLDLVQFNGERVWRTVWTVVERDGRKCVPHVQHYVYAFGIWQEVYKATVGWTTNKEAAM